MPVVIRSTRLEALAGSLAENLDAGDSQHPLDFDAVVVAHPGMEHWLRLQLAHRRDGILSGRFALPYAFAGSLLRARDQAADGSPLDRRTALTWLILAALDDAGSGQLPPLPQAPPQDSAEAALRRYEFAAQLAGLYEQYSFDRPEWLQQWQSGPLPPARDGDGWDSERAQAALWQRLTAQVAGAGDYRPHRAGALMQFDPEAADLPPGIHLFALPTLPAFLRHLIRQLGDRDRVFIYDLVPSLHYHGDVRRLDGEPLTAADRPAGERLLGLLGQVARENQTLFQHMQDDAAERERGAFSEITAEPDPGEPESFLARVQRAITSLDGRPLAAPAPDDLSLRVYSCHNPMREVQVLRDALLELFERNRDLDPSQVLVMAPDIAEYEPWIGAVFGAVDNDLALPWSLADRPSHGRNPLVRTLLSLLHPDFAQPSLAQMFELLEQPGLRHRLDLDGSAVRSLENWCRQNGARVGSQGLAQGLEQPFSWDRALGRLLLGFAMNFGAGSGAATPVAPPEDRLHWEGARWVSALYLLVREIYSLREIIATAPDTRTWRSLCARLCDLVLPTDDSESTALEDFADSFQAVLRDADRAGVARVSAEVLHADLLGRLDARGLERGFLRGRVTFCSLLPLRSVPARVIALLGMNADFPRNPQPPGLDLTARQPQVGDRSVRTDDLNAFLQALMAARQHLIICYRGRERHRPEVLAPSIAVCELLDLVEREEDLVVETPLQPFSPLYGTGKHRTFSAEWLPVAEQAGTRR